MQSFEFLTQLDNFEFSSGQTNILLLGTHAFSDKSKAEAEYHLADFLVSPFLQQLKNTFSHEFYILENKIPRKIVDMNRLEARLNDTQDDNDFLYRQMIRFLATYMQNKFQSIPLIFDLHSFPKDDETWDSDLMLLIQTKKGTITNPSLVNFTQEYFEKKEYTIGTTTQHNPDDIVEELSSKQLAIPLLIEINERFLDNPMDFKLLIEDIGNYLHAITCISAHFQIIRQKSDAKMLLQAYRTSNLNIKPKLITKIKDREIREKVVELSNLLQLFQTKVKDSDMGYASLLDLNENLNEISNGGDNFELICREVISTLSNHLNSIIIPLELIKLNLQIYYSNINKLQLKEWALNLNNMVQILANLKGIDFILPVFRNDPSESHNLLFKSFPKDDYFCNFGIFLSNFKLIATDSLTQDLQFIKDLIGISLSSDPKQIKNQLKKLKDSIFD